MIYTDIDGFTFEKMLLCGFSALKVNENTINGLNVFPVPDGDTGTNMRLTLENALKKAGSCAGIGDYSAKLATGMLYGARGNSGVILSQLFKGISLSLAGCGRADADTLSRAFVSAYKTAYAAVLHPVEGTILTVAREGIEETVSGGKPAADIAELLERYIDSMKRSLERTPEILPVLKEAGVLDSGAIGYLTVIGGMLGFLRGQEPGDIVFGAEKESQNAPDLSSFGRGSAFELGYCTEFILQLTDGKCDVDAFSCDSFTADISRFGDSVVCVMCDTAVKVHIHSFCPDRIIAEALKYGEFVSFKLENMQLQHNETVKEKPEKMPERDFGIIAVADGEGIGQLFRDFGCDIILPGGQSMNTPAQDFIDAFERINAGHIVVLPNNKNIENSALQAVSLSGLGNISVLPSRNFIEGYYGLAMDIGDEPDAEKRVQAISDGIEAVASVEITSAVRDFSSSGFSCREGDYIAFSKGEPVAAEKDLAAVVAESIKKIPDFGEKCVCIVFKGAEAGVSDGEIEDVIGSVIPDCDVTVIDGGQKMYQLLIGLV